MSVKTGISESDFVFVFVFLSIEEKRGLFSRKEKCVKSVFECFLGNFFG